MPRPMPNLIPIQCGYDKKTPDPNNEPETNSDPIRGRLIPLSTKILKTLVPPNSRSGRLVPLSDKSAKGQINGRLVPLSQYTKKIECHISQEEEKTKTEEVETDTDELDTVDEEPENSNVESTMPTQGRFRTKTMRPLRVMLSHLNNYGSIGSSISKNINNVVSVSNKNELEEFVRKHQCPHSFAFIENVKAKELAKIGDKVSAAVNSNDVTNVYCCPSKNTFLNSTLNLTKIDASVFDRQTALYTGQFVSAQVTKLLTSNEQTPLKTINSKIIYDPIKSQVCSGDMVKNVLGTVYYQPDNSLYLFTS